MNITTSKQAEKLAEIGAEFKRIREDKDLSMQHLTATTLISERYLRAIEDGQIECLPEPVYVRGFIRKYGNALGVGDLSEDFPLNSALPESKWAGSAAAELRPLHLYALYIGVIASAVSLLATFLNSPDANKINDSQTNFGKAAQIGSPKISKPMAIADTLLPKIGGLEILNQLTSANPSQLPAQPAIDKPQANRPIIRSSSILNSAVKSWIFGENFQNSQTNPLIAANGDFVFVGNKPVNIGIVMKGQSWLRIGIDGKTEFEGVLNEGKKLVWSGDRQITVRAGNASAVALSYNNQPIKVLGKEGEVAERIFGINQVSITETNDSGLGGFVEFMSSSDTP